MLAGIIQIKVHLAGIGVREFSGFEIDEHEALQPPMKEHQIDTIPFVTDAEALLASDEGEIVAQLEQEMFKVKNQCLFQG